MKRFFFTASLVVASILVGCLLVEGVLRLLIDKKTADGFQQRAVSYTLDHVTVDGSCSWSETTYPHPLLDIVQYNPPGCTPRANRDGFEGPEFPLTNDPATFDILVLGGSVAHQMIANVNPDVFLGRLEKLRDPAGRPVRVFGSGVGGWKQPQQLIAYTLYQERFDGIISIEGFNEVSQLENKGASLLQPFHTSAAYHRFPDAPVGLHLWLASTMKRSLRVPGLRDSYFYQLIYETLKRYIEDDFWKKFLASEAIRRYRMTTDGETDISTYQKFLTNLEVLTDARKQPLAVFLQPVPGIAKPLAPEEIPHLDGKRKYAVYEEVVRVLTASSRKVHPILDVFQEDSSWIYQDSVHARIENGESPGYRKIGTRIIETLIKEWKLKK